MAEKIAIIVQRYGKEINGGAEYHARLIAEHLQKFFSVEVFTSTALDYITWKHHYPSNQEELNGIVVNRYRVKRERDRTFFGTIQEKVFNEEHCLQDELLWLEEEGPLLESMLADLDRRQNEFSFLFFFSYRYWHAYHGVKRFPLKSILVPTAEHDPAIYLYIFKEFFHLPQAIIYNSLEEKELINRVSANEQILSAIVGVGSEIPESFFPKETCQKYNLNSPYIIYIGRLDENKGIPQLCEYFLRYKNETFDPLKLVLIGQEFVSLPAHPDIIHLGFIVDQEKFDLLVGSEFLVIPSQFESLSMVTLEAWACAKAVLANGNTAVLRGQCQRSNGGLWYRDYTQFRELVSLLRSSKTLANTLGQNGQNYFSANYSWPVIEAKYLQIIEQVKTMKNKEV